MDTINASVLQAQKTTSDNARNLQSLLVGMENLAENVKKLSEEVRNWEEPVWQEEVEREQRELTEELMQEVPLTILAVSEPSQSFNITIPPASNQVLTPPSSSTPVFAFEDQELQEIMNRFVALKSPIPVSQSVLSQGFSVRVNALPKDQTP